MPDLKLHLYVVFSVWCYCGGVEVLLDSRDSGFFLSSPDDFMRHATRGELSRRFTLTFSNPVTVRAQFGPFSVRQTVLGGAVPRNNATHDSSGSDLEFLSDPDVTAHFVTNTVRRDRPSLRILFHSGTEMQGASVVSARLPTCVILYAQLGEESYMSMCSSNRDGACLAELTLPAHWWPPLWTEPRKAKSQRPLVKLRYAVLRNSPLECSGHSLPIPNAPLISGLPLGQIALSLTHGSYEAVSNDGVVRILVPQGPVYPRSRVYVPVFARPNPVYPLHSFTIKARVRTGLRILDVQPMAKQFWKIAVDINEKRTVATVTVNRLETAVDIPEHEEEVFDWLFEVQEGAGYEDSGHITWQLRYQSSSGEKGTVEDESIKLSARLDIQKDDVEAVLLVAKSTQLLNTAVLTGKQVSHPMKVFVVSQSGLVGDVTLQSSCHSADESILKVSPSCTSVYLDGSEIRGSQNATVLVKYGTYTGQAHFLVWMPELPLEVRLSDTKLSQIKGWRTPQRQKSRRAQTIQNDMAASWANRLMLHDRPKGNEKWEPDELEEVVCRLRYQQSKVEVYTRFLSIDHNSGREAYLLGRKTQVSVTDLVTPFVRVADPHIAILRGTLVQGLNAGRTEVQVLSPITGKVLGATEVRVSTDKETVTQLDVKVVTGLSLAVLPDDSTPGVFVAKTTTSHGLTSLYQEGLLDIVILFSDGTATPLADIMETDYHLTVDTSDNSVVAFAPISSGMGLAHPRVIAVGEGRGDLLQVTLELAERCHKRRSQPLATAYSYVEAEFAQGRQGSPDTVLYQDGVRQPHEPTVQARQNVMADRSVAVSPLEVGMYALLGVFCLAVVVFVASCTVFAVRYHRKAPPSPPETISHAHDWVWLGRATLERNSVNTRCSQSLVPDRNGNPIPPRPPPRAAQEGSTISIRITTNPQYLEGNGSTEKLKLIEEEDEKRCGTEKRQQAHIRTNPMLTFTRPPPVPPHRNLASKEEKEKENKENPDAGWETMAKGMNYDQLMEYFDSLKESSA